MTLSDVCPFFLKACVPNVRTSSDESRPSKVAEVALPLLRGSSDPTGREEPNTPDFDGVYTKKDLIMSDLPKVDEIPKENNVSRVMGSPVILNNNPSPPPTPRASTRATPQPKFFDEEPSVVKEVIPAPSKEKVLARSNEVQKTLSIIRRRKAEGITETKPMTLEEFNEKMTQGRISRCIKLFESGANRNAIKLLMTFDKATQERLLQHLENTSQSGFVVEVTRVIIRETWSGSASQKWAVDCFLKFFEEGKEREAMLLCAVIMTSDQKKEIAEHFIKAKRFNDVRAVAMLMNERDLHSICSRLILDKEYDYAMSLVYKIRYPLSDCFLEECERLIVDGRADLAVNLSKEKLTDKSRYKLCNLLMGKCDPKIITQISDQMQDGTDKQKIMDQLTTKVVITA